MWKYQYDLNNRLWKKTKPHESWETDTEFSTEYRFDALDRVTKELPATMGYSTSDQLRLGIGRVVYTYDTQGNNGWGRLARTETFHGSDPVAALVDEFTYNEHGQVLQQRRQFTQTDLFAASADMTVTRLYNAMGQLRQSFWSDGQRWEATYDARGLPSELIWYDAGKRRPIITYQRGLAGQARSVLSPNTRYKPARNVQRDYTFDVHGRVKTDRIWQPGSGTQHSQRTYEFSDTGDLKRLSGATAGMNVGANYYYDALHRVGAELRDDGGLSSFSYYGHKTGNFYRTTISGGGESVARQVEYVYGGDDPQAVTQLLNTGGIKDSFLDIEYDKAGNVTRRYGTSVTDTTYRWDGQDRMREADDGTTNQEIYHYDSGGQRYLAVNAIDGVRFWFAEREMHFKPKNAATTYLHISDGGTTSGRVTDGVELEIQYQDSLKNLMLSLDADGDVLAAFSYSAFGEVVEKLGDVDGHRRRFNGKEQDKRTGLRYYGARYYDPLLMRWTAGDPLFRFAPEIGMGSPRRLNLYAFSGNNPLRFYDPDGLSEHDPDIVDEGVDTDGVPFMNFEFIGEDEEEDGALKPDARWSGFAATSSLGSYGSTGETNARDLLGGPRLPRNSLGVPPNGDYGAWRVSQGIEPTRLAKYQKYEAAAIAAAFACVVGVCPAAAVAAGRAGAWAAARWTALWVTTAGVVAGPYGEVSRKVLERASAAGGATIRVFTRLTQGPVAGRGLSVAGGPGAQRLVNQARAVGTVFQARIPTRLIVELEKVGLVTRSLTRMGGATATEYRFAPTATEFVVDFFK